MQPKFVSPSILLATINLKLRSICAISNISIAAIENEKQTQSHLSSDIAMLMRLQWDMCDDILSEIAQFDDQ